MDIIINVVIYVIAIIGIIFTYISLNDNEDIEYFRVVEHEDGIRKVEIEIRFANYDEEEKQDILKQIKNGNFDNLNEVVDKIMIKDI